MNGLDKVFIKLKDTEQKAFIAYINAGDPDLQSTYKIMEKFVKNGIDIIELGVPFSDPIGDGPVNQAGALRAIKSGTTLKKILLMIQTFTKKYKVPIVLFSYLNPIHDLGIDNFCQLASKAKISGVLLVDSPYDMSFSIYNKLKTKNIHSIFLVSPTTNNDRIKQIAKYSGGFIYYVSSLGVTGIRKSFDANIAKKINNIKKFTDKPICVGFGISNPENASNISKLADGVIVGSAFVKIIESNLKNKDQIFKKLSVFTKKMVNAVKKN